MTPDRPEEFWKALEKLVPKATNMVGEKEEQFGGNEEEMENLKKIK